MAEVTERDRELFWTLHMPYSKGPESIAAYREAAVAEERAKWRDALFPGNQDTTLGEHCLDPQSAANVIEEARRLDRGALADSEAARQRAEQERDRAVAQATEQESLYFREMTRAEAAEARLRAVIEAADMLVNCAEAHEAHAWHETYRCKEGVCICGLKAMQAHLDDALAAYRRVRDAQASDAR